LGTGTALELAVEGMPVGGGEAGEAGAPADRGALERHRERYGSGTG